MSLHLRQDRKGAHFAGRWGARFAGQVDMLHGSLLDKILLFALPLAASTILQQLFNSADVAVVGRFDSRQALAAVGSNGPAINLLVNLFVGVSLGTNVVIAHYIGQNERQKIRDAVHTSISLALISGFFLLAWGLVMARPLLRLMDTPEDVMELSVLYLRIYFLGMPFIMLFNFGSAILRSRGDSQRPLWCLAVSGVINVILNLILVIVFRLSVAGVGIATVIANAVSASMVIRFLMTADDPFRFYPRQLLKSENREHALRMLRIGIPTGMQGVVFSISNICIQAAINGFGSAASAGSATALNFEFIAYYIINAFTQAAVTFTSQNYGAGNVERCRRVFRLSLWSGLLITGTVCAAFLFWQHPLLSLYTLDPGVIAFAEVRMFHAVAFVWLCSTYEVSGGALRGMGYSMLPTTLTLLGCCAFRLVWVYGVIWGMNGSFALLMDTYPITWTITGTATLIAYFRIRRRAFALFDKEKEAVSPQP
ncbi:MAG: MATE family efflux transporter [Fretibacterium sp.]|nr:MATE family efflux transporter [Fretibacterium sp.]